MARRFFRRKFGRRSVMRTSSRRSRSGGVNPLAVVLPAMAYGAGRSWLSNAIQPITSRVPLGNYADEIVLGLAGWYIAKKNLFGMKNLGIAVLTVESAAAGAQLAAGSGASTTPTGYIYG